MCVAGFYSVSPILVYTSTKYTSLRWGHLQIVFKDMFEASQSSIQKAVILKMSLLIAFLSKRHQNPPLLSSISRILKEAIKFKILEFFFSGSLSFISRFLPLQILCKQIWISAKFNLCFCSLNSYSSNKRCQRCR